MKTSNFCHPELVSRSENINFDSLKILTLGKIKILQICECSPAFTTKTITGNIQNLKYLHYIS